MRKTLCVLALVAGCALMFQATVTAGIQPPTAKSHGANLGEWAKRFFVFDGGVPVVDGSHPALDAGDVDCGLGQSGKVWFLETAPSLVGDYERRCTIPTGTALYVPVFQWFCSPDLLAGEVIAECLAQADGAFGAVELGLSVDGVALDDAALDAYRSRTGTFRLPLAADNYWEVAFGIELGSSITFAADAIGALVTPLSVGTHTIVVSAASEEFGFGGTLTYRLTVAPRGK
ncbi:MAG: hypothetical protein ACXWZB_10505 [Gaiellaceae bacterium]